jgi:hypothetical protein
MIEQWCALTIHFVLYISQGQYRGFWDSTPPGLMAVLVISTTDYTVAIGIECLRHSLFSCTVNHALHRGGISYLFDIPGGVE